MKFDFHEKKKTDIFRSLKKSIGKKSIDRKAKFTCLRKVKNFRLISAMIFEISWSPI